MPIKKEWVKLNCEECGNEFSVMPYRAKSAKYCGWMCGQRAKNKKSTVVNAANLRGTGRPDVYVKEGGRHQHRVAAERKLGRALLRGEIVHHVDGNKHNNHPDNLEVMTQSEHIKLHLPEMHKIRRANLAA